MALVSDILQKVDAVTLNYTAQSYQAIVARHSTELHLMLVVYVALYGLAVLQGLVPATTREMSKHILKCFIVFELATNWGMFTTFFYDVFTTGPDKLTGALTNGIKPSEQLSGIFEAGMTSAVTIFNKAGTFDVGIMVTGLLVALGTLLMTGYALFLIILGKLGLAILLSLAPLFIALSLWKGTQGIFQSWINYLVNLALIPVVTYGLLALLVTLMQEAAKTIETAGEAVTMPDVIPYLLIGSIAALLFSQVNRIASSLGSGVALSTMGAFSRYVHRPAQQMASQVGAKLSKTEPKLSKVVNDRFSQRQNSASSQFSSLKIESKSSASHSNFNSKASEHSLSSTSSRHSELGNARATSRPSREYLRDPSLRRPVLKREARANAVPSFFSKSSKPSGANKNES